MKEKISISIDSELLESLKIMAQQENRSLSNLMERTMAVWLITEFNPDDLKDEKEDPKQLKIL